MNRVNWDASPLENGTPKLPANLRETIFDYLPPPVPMTPVMEEMAHKYESGEWTKAPQHYGPLQAAYFIRPRSPDFHRQRRDAFRLRAAEAEGDGFVVPDIFRELVETDAYVDRLHHGTIWLEMPEELWRLPSCTTTFSTPPSTIDITSSCCGRTMRTDGADNHRLQPSGGSGRS